MIDEIRKLVAQILAGWIVRLWPSRPGGGHEVQSAILDMVAAMGRDAARPSRRIRKGR